MSAERPIFQHVISSAEKNIDRAEWMLGNAEKLTKFVDEYGALEEASRHIEEGAYPIFISNHLQHVNVAEFRRIARMLRVRPRNLYVAIAQSLTGGEQGEDLGNASRGIENVLRAENMHFIKFARPKDIELYRRGDNDKGIKPDREKAHRLIRETRDVQNFLLETVSEDAGLMFFPEATTEGAVKGINGKRKGTQKANTPLLSLLFSEADRVEREVVCVPFANVGTNNIVEPRTTHPHVRAMFEIGKSELSRGLLNPRQLAETRMGRPFTLSDIKNEKINFLDINEINDFAMRRVVENIPEEDRGYYR